MSSGNWRRNWLEICSNTVASSAAKVERSSSSVSLKVRAASFRLQFREQRLELGVRRAGGGADDIGEHGNAQFELRFRHRFIPDEC